MLMLSIPLSGLMLVLAEPAAVAVFHRGRLTRDDAVLLGIALAVYAVSLVGSAVQRAMLAPFFARFDTHTPLRNTVYGVVANLALVPLLVLPFGRDNANGILGVAAAYSLAQYVNVGHAWYRMHRDLDIRLDGLAPFVWRLVAATVVMTAVLVAGFVAFDLGAPHGRWVLLLETCLVGAVGLVVLAGVLKLFGGGEFVDLSRSFRRGGRGGPGAGGPGAGGPGGGGVRPRGGRPAPVSGTDGASSRT
jgi:putative peptidoglycan lipid II flippase